MSWIIFFFGTGLAFFTGVALLFGALCTACFWRGKWAARVMTLTAVVGLLLIAFSAAPLPYWFCGVAVGCTSVWMVAERWEALARRRFALRFLVAAVWFVALLFEAPYVILPTVPDLGRPRLVLIGDSVAAGANERGVTAWPTLLARDHGLDVLDLSRPGATVRSATRRVLETELADNDFVLLEIGGNDVLGSTTVADFERGLQELLVQVCGSKRFILMFDLPVPPFHNDYAMVVRRLTAAHGVRLIPKWVFIRVLTTDQATIDSIHLTPSGHLLMSETAWSLISPAFRK